MSFLQRCLLICGLIATAAFLHVQLCEWQMEAKPVYPGQTLLIGKAEMGAVGGVGNPNAVSGQIQTPTQRGILAEIDVARSDAVVFGLALPFLMLVIAFCLMFGWRGGARLRQGRCPSCGYDLRGKIADGCPECGWRR